MKQLYANVRIQVEKDWISVENRNLFSGLSGYTFEERVEKEGDLISVRELSFQAEPGMQARIAGADLPADPGEYTVTVIAKQTCDTIYAPAGHEVCFGQGVFVVPEQPKVSEKRDSSEDDISVIDGDVNVGVSGNGFFAMFSRSEGGIVSLVYNGREYITRTPKLTFFRAATDNDTGMEAFYQDSGWLAATRGMRFLKESFVVQEEDKVVTVSMAFEAKYPEVFQCTMIYRMDVTGRLEMTMQYPGIHVEEYLPLFGIDFKMKKELNRFCYYGYGPEENYADRMCGARLGVFSASVCDNLSQYLIPQECGNREGVRWIKVLDEGGDGLCFWAKEEAMAASVLPVSAYELDSTMHIDELPGHHYTWVRLMAKQTGVGGDDSWGAPVHTEYRIPASKPQKLSIFITPVVKGK